MRVAITGGTGFIGSHLVKHLREHGHVPVVLTRDAAHARPPAGHLPSGTEVKVVDYEDVPSVARALEGCEGIVNLAGASLLAKRWRKAFKVEIRASRVIP